MEKGEFMVNYTTKDIMDKLDKQEHKLEQIHSQTKKTNGRVSVIEAKSIGMWISLNPFKFAAILMIIIAFVISDIRHPLLALVSSLFI